MQATAEARRRQLADHLSERGVLTTPGLREAVERVPRHRLVPRFYHTEWEEAFTRTGYEPVDSSQPERWLAAVYDPGRSLITEYDPRNLCATSSATMPRMVVSMLDTLKLSPGLRVLEIGTGSGYSTALLCEMVGAENVVSVEAGGAVAELASRRLEGAGYRPAVITADGFEGHPAGAPYDRVMSACTAARVPRAWVEQMRPGGLLLATLPNAMPRLTRHEDGSASGRLDSRGYGFMWMRHHSPVHGSAEELLGQVHGAGEGRATRIDPAALRLKEPAPAFWSLFDVIHAPFAEVFTAGPDERGLVDHWGSWALVDTRRGWVTQGGPRRLWDLAEELFRFLDEQGWPARWRFGMTVFSDGRQRLWLDRPESGHVWELSAD